MKSLGTGGGGGAGNAGLYALYILIYALRYYLICFGTLLLTWFNFSEISEGAKACYRKESTIKSGFRNVWCDLTYCTTPDGIK